MSDINWRETSEQIRGQTGRRASDHNLAQKLAVHAERSKTDYATFCQFMRPHLVDPDNLDLSDFQLATHIRAIIEALEKVASGEIKRLAISMPPRHSKSETVSRLFPPFFVGQNPGQKVIFATYNQDLANDFGKDVRDVLKNPRYQLVFPSAKLRTDSQSVDSLRTENRGFLQFRGVGGGITGRGANLLIIDDPVRGATDAASPSTRERIWQWYVKDARTRLMPGAAIIVVMTRWSEDDLLGRILDPDNPCYSEAEAEKWTYLKLPALKGGRALWPEWFDVEYLEEVRKVDERTFEALYQQNPTPDQGVEFMRNSIQVYDAPKKRPDGLNWYAALDLAVSAEAKRDHTCLGIVGMDSDGDLWVHEDILWVQKTTDHLLTDVARILSRHNLMEIFTEKGPIHKAFEPLLKRELIEQDIYINFSSFNRGRGKSEMASSIRGRVNRGRVHFPSYADWWPRAFEQLLKFPNGTEDDFVDMMALLGLGLQGIIQGAGKKESQQEIKTGTIAWVKQETKRKEQEDAIRSWQI